MKGIWVLGLAVLATAALAAERVVLFEQFTSIT
jgi:hypothetical protein